jgi:uncharacterized membrane protein YqaE (UPF0057 family)
MATPRHEQSEFDRLREEALTRNHTATDTSVTMPVTATDPIKLLLAILLPPVGVFLEVGLGTHFWINILLTLLGYIPGIIHALYVILKK